MTANAPDASALSDAARKWPDVQIAPDQILAAWVRLTDTVESPHLEHLSDLYLAVAALEGHSAALQHLSSMMAALKPRLHGFGLDASQLDVLVNETLSLIVEKNLLKRYGARGSLEGWLLVILGRAAAKAAKAAHSTVELDEVLLGDLTTQSAPELELLKQRFKGVFSEAFRSAISRLSVRHRNLLRQHYLDQLSLDELGLIYRSHRSTVARWLADARTALLEGTRTVVSEKLGVARLEVDSLMRAVQSRLDLSAGVFLEGAKDDHER